MADGLPLSQEEYTKLVSLSVVVDVAGLVSFCVIVVYGAGRAFSRQSVCSSESTTSGSSTPLKLKADRWKMNECDSVVGCD